MVPERVKSTALTKEQTSMVYRLVPVRGPLWDSKMVGEKVLLMEIH